MTYVDTFMIGVGRNWKKDFDSRLSASLAVQSLTCWILAALTSQTMGASPTTVLCICAEDDVSDDHRSIFAQLLLLLAAITFVGFLQFRVVSGLTASTPSHYCLPGLLTISEMVGRPLISTVAAREGFEIGTSLLELTIAAFA